MIKNTYYFVSCFASSLIIAYFMSYRYKDFAFYYMFYTIVLFIIIGSITIFPFTYYNHLSEALFIKKVKKYSLNDINGMDNNFNALVKNNNYNVIKKIIKNKNIEAKIVMDSYSLYFYQLFETHILSDMPFLTININNIIEISQKNARITLSVHENIDFKCNFFIIRTYNTECKLFIQNCNEDNFIEDLYKNYNKLKF